MLEENRKAAFKTKKQRNWEVLPGRNNFYFGGRIIMAQRLGFFYLTLFLIVTTSTIFFVYDCPFLSDQLSPVIPIVAALLFLFVMSNLFKTSFSDPGIIPRATRAEAMANERQDGVDNGTVSTYQPPRTKVVRIKNQKVKLKVIQHKHKLFNHFLGGSVMLICLLYAPNTNLTKIQIIIL